MKKIFTIFVAICLLAIALCIPSFAADAPAAGTVIRVSALKTGGSPEVIDDYTSFEAGWNAAVTLASSKNLNANGYERIIVDFYADWNSNDKGEFGNDDGTGFDNSTLLIPGDTTITLNLNGYTINRGLTTVIEDGEVMYIGSDANVTINNGTISGGYSNNGAGGIHSNGARVELNNVNIEKNTVENDDGGGIALYSGSTLIMNGGSISDNMIITYNDWSEMYGGGIYASASTVVLKDVTFANNNSKNHRIRGSVLYADDSSVTMDNCMVIDNDNGIMDKQGYILAARCVIYGVDSTFTIKGTTFRNNSRWDTWDNYEEPYALISLVDSELVVSDNCKFTENPATCLLRVEDTKITLSDSDFTNNKVLAIYGSVSSGSTITRCKFSSGGGAASFRDTFQLTKNSTIYFTDCDFGDATIEQEGLKYIVTKNCYISDEKPVLRVSGLKKDGTSVILGEYYNLLFGWNAALEQVQTQTGYDRIVIDLYTDWNTGADGSMILSIPENARVTLNMNGHTVNRNFIGGYNGEVVYISVGADVIINDGTITGGDSASGAGGIHIKDNARVVLNNVNVVGNCSQGSKGAAIAVHSGAVLIMNGGSLSDNSMKIDDYIVAYFNPDGTLYVYNATATLNNVTIANNKLLTVDGEGAAIYADDSTVTLNDCVVSGNATEANGKYGESVIGAFDSKLIINNTEFTNNGAVSAKWDADYSHLFYLEDSSLTMEGGKITGNKADKLFYFNDSKADIKGVTMTGNESVVLDVDNSSEKVTLTECVLGNNSPVKYDEDIIVDTEYTLVLNRCTLGDTTFEDKSMVEGVGSVIGEGSFTKIISLLAIVVSAASICISVNTKKKKAISVKEDE